MSEVVNMHGKIESGRRGAASWTKVQPTITKALTPRYGQSIYVIYIYIYMYNISLSMYIYIYIYTHRHVCVYIYIYIHVYTHMYVHRDSVT